MKTREIICEFYTCAGGNCLKRDKNVYFSDECQTCKWYTPKKGSLPKRVDNRRKKLEKAQKGDWK